MVGFFSQKVGEKIVLMRELSLTDARSGVSPQRPTPGHVEPPPWG